MKPGWQTTEFWITLISQLLALLAITGAISVGDKEQLETALTNAVTAIFTLITSTVIVVRYIRSRTGLKAVQPPAPPGRMLLLLAALTGLLLAAAPAAAATPPVRPSCFLGCRPQGTDPAVLAALQQIAQNQQTIINLLQQRPAAPPPPSIIVLNPQWPRQDIPLGAAPRQEIPLGDAPRQDIPIGAAPKQDIPPGAPPRQEIPLGPPPRPEALPPSKVDSNAPSFHRYRQVR